MIEFVSPTSASRIADSTDGDVTALIEPATPEDDFDGVSDEGRESR